VAEIEFKLNGAPVAVKAGDDEPLLYVLRNQLGASSVRFGCGLEQCGCCVVLVDGAKAYACTLPAVSVADKLVETVEGLARPDGRPGPIQQAFLDEQAGQCGYCLSGMLMATKALLAANPTPSRADIVEALDDQLCRCGAHARIVKAVARAAGAST